MMNSGNMNGKNMEVACLLSDRIEYFQKPLELFNAAIQTNLPQEHEANGKCLIPVDLEFKFIEK